MAGIEWGILPITDWVETRGDTRYFCCEINEGLIVRSAAAVNRIIGSFEWEESGQKTLSETPNGTKFEGI